MSDQFDVGATVRVPRSLSKATSKATIATIQAEENSATVLFEPLAPRPLIISPKSASAPLDKDGAKVQPKRRLKRCFLVSPTIEEQGSGENDQEMEATVDISDVKALLDFENEKDGTLQHSETNYIESIPIMKECGDQLLRLGDPSTACSYYEMALHLSSILQVGSSVIVKEGGHAVVADVDCLDDDDIEVTMVTTEEEKVIQEKNILLCILHNDLGEDGHKQERILLNLARCLLQLAEVAKHQEMASVRRPQYLRSAVLAATLASTISEHHNAEETTCVVTFSSLHQTALLLRSKAQAGLSKFPNAITDMKRLLSKHPEHKEGLKQMQSLQTQMQRQKHVDKKLVKSMCKLVSAATDNPVSDSMEISLVAEERQGHFNIAPPDDKRTAADVPASMVVRSVYNVVLFLILPLLFAYVLQGLLN